jgi:hypothetical protein
VGDDNELSFLRLDVVQPVLSEQRRFGVQ